MYFILYSLYTVTPSAKAAFQGSAYQLKELKEDDKLAEISLNDQEGFLKFIQNFPKLNAEVCRRAIKFFRITPTV